nr:hypothetical protein GCM10020092_029830 [Actinoplanes digitatis]
MSTGVVRHKVDATAAEPEERPDLILVVDDDEDIASFVAFNLKVHGFEVMRARDGQHALEVMETRRPDLAVVDWMMPNMNGVELTRRLRAEPLTSALPVIMLTAKGMTVDKVVGLTAGVDDYLVKPFDTAELIARVSSTLRRNKEFREVSPLTGLPGNARVRREIVDRMKTAKDFAVGYIDIDRFKSVNDVYGFDRGDEFITALAQQPAPRGREHRAPADLPGPHRRRRLRLHLYARAGPAADQADRERLRDRRRPALRHRGRPARLHRGARPARQQAARGPGHALDRRRAGHGRGPPVRGRP